MKVFSSSQYNGIKKEYNCHSEFGNFKFSQIMRIFMVTFSFFPTKKYSLRVIRRSSNHNTISLQKNVINFV